MQPTDQAISQVTDHLFGTLAIIDGHVGRPAISTVRTSPPFDTGRSSPLYVYGTSVDQPDVTAQVAITQIRRRRSDVEQ